MIASAMSRFANHVLAPAGWAREKLAMHAGKVARFEVPPARFALLVGADGLVQPADAAAEPAVTIKFGRMAVFETLADREQAWNKAEIEGDTAFASAISQVAANLQWDIEEDLSRAFGDIAAHRMAQTGRAAAAWPRRAAHSIAANAAEYLTEEAHLLATPLQVEEFIRGVDELRDAAERLEKRIERLSRGG
ncbi:MAG TPA: sterol-binding protein [Burkholderiales bacterium]